MSIPRLHCFAYTIAWVCPLPKDLPTVVAMLDQVHDPPRPSSKSTTAVELLDQLYGPSSPICLTDKYIVGSIGSFNIVITCFEWPSEKFDALQGFHLAIEMFQKFPNLRIGLIVGIGSGVPSEKNDVRLGDVVVSLPRKDGIGTRSYYVENEGRRVVTRRWGSTIEPPSGLNMSISRLISSHHIHDKIQSHLLGILERHPNLNTRFTRPKSGDDILHQPESERTEPLQSWRRVARQARQPHGIIKAHYGSIASAHPPIRSGQRRDALSQRLGGVSCFEKSPSRIIEGFTCVVVRGICDYADVHMTSEWEEYSAAVAAAFAKELITTLPITINKCPVEKQVKETLVRGTGTTSPIQMRNLGTSYGPKKNSRVFSSLASMSLLFFGC